MTIRVECCYPAELLMRPGDRFGEVPSRFGGKCIGSVPYADDGKKMQSDTYEFDDWNAAGRCIDDTVNAFRKWPDDCQGEPCSVKVSCEHIGKIVDAI